MPHSLGVFLEIFLPDVSQPIQQQALSVPPPKYIFSLFPLPATISTISYHYVLWEYYSPITIPVLAPVLVLLLNAVTVSCDDASLATVLTSLKPQQWLLVCGIKSKPFTCRPWFPRDGTPTLFSSPAPPDFALCSSHMDLARPSKQSAYPFTVVDLHSLSLSQLTLR